MTVEIQISALTASTTSLLGEVEALKTDYLNDSILAVIVMATSVTTTQSILVDHLNTLTG